MAKDIILVVGLGNPGFKYDQTRHNVGFACIEAINDVMHSSSEKEKFEALIAETLYRNIKLITAKPTTYMNNSGISIRQIMDFYKIPLSNIIVIHDEIDLKVGKTKIKIGGGSAGHNGIKSLSSHIGNDYLRIRIGVGHPGDKDQVADYVLSKFSKEEQIIIDQLIKKIADNFNFILDNQQDEFITKMGALE